MENMVIRRDPGIAATIRKDQKAWLDGHPSINVSGLLQEAIDQKIEAEKAQKE